MTQGAVDVRPVAEVREHNGTPTVFVDGKPVSYHLAWMPAPDPNDPDTFQKVTRALSQRGGIHLYAYENGIWRWGPPGPQWAPGPGEGHTGTGTFPGWSGSSSNS